MHIWSANGSLAGTLAGRVGYYGLGWSPDSRHLAVISQDQMMRIVSPTGRVESKRPLRQRMWTAGPVAWSPDGKEVAAGGAAAISVLSLTDGLFRESKCGDRDDFARGGAREGVPNRNLDKWLIHVDIDGPWQVLCADGSLGPKLPGIEGQPAVGDRVEPGAGEIRSRLSTGDSTLPLVARCPVCSSDQAAD